MASARPLLPMKCPRFVFTGRKGSACSEQVTLLEGVLQQVCMCQVVFVPLAFVCVCICVSVLFPAAAFRRSGSAGQGQGMYRRRNMHTHTQAHTQSQRHRPTYARRQQHVVSGNVVPWQGVRAASSVATSKAQNSRLLSSSSWQLRLSCRCSAYMHFWSSKMRFCSECARGASRLGNVFSFPRRQMWLDSCGRCSLSEGFLDKKGGSWCVCVWCGSLLGVVG